MNPSPAVAMSIATPKTSVVGVEEKVSSLLVRVTIKEG
jgi:hypothetical protein